MKKSKFLIIASLVTFGAISIFGTKPNKKFVGATKAFASGYGSMLFSGASASAHLTTTTIVGQTAQFKTAGTSATSTMRTSSGGLKLYFH